MVRQRLDLERHGSGGFTSWRRLAALGMAVSALLVGSYLALQGWYSGRMMPGVVAGGRNVGGITMAQARATLRDVAGGYRLRLHVAGEHYEVTADDLGVTFDIETTLNMAYQTGRSWWPQLHTEPLPLSYHVDGTRLNAFTQQVAERVGTPPVDAGVVVEGASVKAAPDKTGLTVDRVGLTRLIEDDLQAPGRDGLTLQPRPLVADIQAEALGPTLAEATRLMATPVVLTYQDKTFTPSQEEIGQWLAFEKQVDGGGYKLAVKVDAAKVKGYVQGLANALDVAPVTEQVTIRNGVREVTKPGVKGMAVDQDAATAAVTAAVGDQKALTYAMTAHEVAYQSVSTTVITLDYGRYVEVNLSRQHLWVWQDHQVIYETPITSGATGAGFPTATGLFSIYYKTTNTHLRGYQYGPQYNYDVFVKYWMPFYQGFGLHDASWRSSFGGPDYYYGGSHGCVNMPEEAAAFIYGWADVGTPVWVHT